MSNLISTTDLYEACFYLMQGFKIEKVEIVNQNRKEMGKFILSGEGIQKAQLVYLNGEATRQYYGLPAYLQPVDNACRAGKKGTPGTESPRLDLGGWP